MSTEVTTSEVVFTSLLGGLLIAVDVGLVLVVLEISVFLMALLVTALLVVVAVFVAVEGFGFVVKLEATFDVTDDKGLLGTVDVVVDEAFFKVDAAGFEAAAAVAVDEDL